MRLRQAGHHDAVVDPIAAAAGGRRHGHAGIVAPASGRIDLMADDDPFDLARFVAAQHSGGTYERAYDELRRGRKTSHWMWFVFPQLAGLGRSPTAHRYAIRSLD